MLNKLVNAYVEKHVSIHRPAGQLAFFDEETTRYKHELDQAEGQLESFSQEQGGVAPQVSRDITLQKLNEFAASLESTRAEMSATEKKIANLEQQAGATPDRHDHLSARNRRWRRPATVEEHAADAGIEAYRTAHQVSAGIPTGAGSG